MDRNRYFTKVVIAYSESQFTTERWVLVWNAGGKEIFKTNIASCKTGTGTSSGRKTAGSGVAHSFPSRADVKHWYSSTSIAHSVTLMASYKVTVTFT